MTWYMLKPELNLNYFRALISIFKKVFNSKYNQVKNYGAFLKQNGGGYRGQVKITGFRNGDVELKILFWTYEVGLKGEFLKLYSEEETHKASWGDLSLDAIPTTFTWYKVLQNGDHLIQYTCIIPYLLLRMVERAEKNERLCGTTCKI
ncbi:hypothetical protein ACFE04_008776 [Oxalis oulophora]